MAQTLTGLRWNRLSRWMHSIGSTDTQSELLHSEINPTGGGFLCPQRHSKFVFRAYRNRLLPLRNSVEATSRWSNQYQYYRH
ncbi:hypothetical protein DXA01_12615 [Bacteroides caccae]|nr:hypothetical protein DXA01_12615 [Bacteroides caccae]RHD23873.1 hypothetical protein DW803_18525 [Bacteroides ovatus]